MKGFVYLIRSNQTDDVYYGSTIQILCKRLAEHRSSYKKCDNKKYMSSFELMKYEDAYIELVEIVEFQDKKELHAREGFYIRNNNCVNKKIMGRTKAEYTIDMRDVKREYDKQYCVDNKDKIKERKKQYHEHNREEILDKNKRRYEENKDVIIEQQRLYREANIDKIREYDRKRSVLRRAIKKAES